MPCLEEAQILAFVSGRCSDEARREVEAHLDACESCLELVAHLGRIPAAGSAPAPDGDAEEPRYELGREIARGGMGRIVEARDRRLRRTVALKLLRSPSPELERRFAREAELVARLEHPGIVPIYDAGTLSDGSTYHALRLVAGDTLDVAIARAPLPADRLALVPAVTAVADAVAYAHGAGVIHRDLKPANVLVGRFGETLLLDWGLAKDLRAGESDAGLIMGTHGYMPPEQARGEVVDPRADVYALGATLYHVLAGAPPRDAAQGEPEPLEHRVTGVPVELIAITQRAMARRAEDRYPSARELAEDLHRFQTGRLVEAHRYSRTELVRRWVARHRGAVAVGAASLAIIATISVLAVRRTLAARDLAERRRVAAEVAGQRAASQRQAAEKLVAYVLGGLRDQLERVGRLDALSGVASEIIDYYDHYAGEPAVSPNDALQARERRIDALGILSEARLAAGDPTGALDAARTESGLAREADAARPGPVNDERLARSLLRLGDALRTAGRTGEAIVAYSECDAIARRGLAAAPGAPPWQNLVAQAAIELATAAEARGDMAAARRLRQEAIDLGGKLDAAGDVHSLWLLVKANADLARQDLADSELARAQARSDAALAAAKRLLDRRPDDVEARHTVAAAWDVVGDVRRARGDVAGAAVAFDAERELVAALLVREPGNLLWRRTMSVVEDNLGQVALDRGDSATALTHFVASRAATAELVAAEPDSPKLIRDLAVSDLHLGDVRQDAGAYADARASYAAAVQDLERLGADPAEADRQRDLAIVLLHAGDLEVEHGDRAAARALLERSTALARKAKRGDDSPAAQQLLDEGLELLKQLDRAAATSRGPRRAPRRRRPRRGPRR